jgi:hypothetical protein
MTLELSKVAQQIEEMGRTLAQRAQRQRRALPAARELLRLFADDRTRLREIAESEDGQRLRCAGPGAELLDARLPAGTPPQKMTIVAADGSQIFPDSHGLAFYYAVNVGTIVYRAGSGQAPEVGTEPRLCYAEDEVYPEGRRVSGALVSAERDVAEMQALARLAGGEAAEGPPCVALRDGPLLIWFQDRELPSGRPQRLLADYVTGLDALRAAAVPAVGYVSRPQSAEVVTLLYLAQLEPAQRGTVGNLAATPFRGLVDRALFGFLAPGERSATFVRGTGANRDFRARGHSVYFFYLNTGSELARVEVPEWVARDAGRIGLVHAAVYDQCRCNEGYPYVLTRADELAVILGAEREVLEEMIARAMARHGLHLPELSAKAQQKRVARWRR